MGGCCFGRSPELDRSSACHRKKKRTASLPPRRLVFVAGMRRADVSRRQLPTKESSTASEGNRPAAYFIRGWIG
jgi:hypothetical protein